MDSAKVMGYVKDAKEAILNMVIVFPNAMKRDETFLDLDASVTELESTDTTDRDAIIMAVKEVQRSLSNFLRVHPEVKADAKYQPVLKDLTGALEKLLQG